ncbi:MAG TPA: TonB-dependent receptor [Terracidiphilus sp.]|nr:TonB-dependent receptor [Terracidiphilus sp.]
MNLRRNSLLLLACCGSCAGVLLAQADYATATIHGDVLDPGGRPIAGAVVSVVNESNGQTKRTVSTGEGYMVPAIAPGSYRVEAGAAGFATTIAKGIVLNVGELAEYDFHLKLSAVSTSIEINANIPLVQPDQTQQANIIENKEVENLPNVSRSFVQSIYTLPGVSNSYAPTLQDPGVGTGYLSSGFSIGASNGRGNLVTIDGGENDYGSGTMRDMHVPIDSIQEFQVNRNAFEAEFGFTSGAAINMVTKSGSNQLKGNVSFYFHDHSIDGGNYFNKLEDSGVKPYEQSAIVGATLGGPIRKNHAFFFTAPEYQSLDSSTVQNIAGEQEFQSIAAQTNGYNGTCPGQNTTQQQVTQLCYLTQMANSGGYAGAVGSALLASPIFGDPFDNSILNALVSNDDGTFDGIPASPVNSGVRGLPGFSTPRGRYFNWVSRVDYSNAKDNFYLRFGLMEESDSVAPRPSYSGNEFQTDYTLTGAWTRVLSPSLINMVRAQVVPSNTAAIQAPSPNGSEIDLGNQIELGTPFSYPFFSTIRRYQLDDNLSRTTGTHIFNFGFSWRPDDYNVQEKLWFGGEWEFTDGTFSILDLAGAAAAQLENFNLSQGYPAAGPPSTNLTAVQAFLSGAPTILLQANPQSNYSWSGWTHLLGIYAQDTWKARPDLTIDYGVRLDYFHDAAPVPHSTRFSPRLGLAWAPGRDNKTVVRAGGGTFVAPNTFMIPFYANILGDSGKYVNQNALVAGLPSPPFPSIFAVWAAAESNATSTEPNPPLTTAQLSDLGINIVPPGPAAYGNFIYTMAPHYQPEYSIEASLSIARQISHNLSLEAAWLMYHSVHVEQVLESNFVQDTSVPIDPFVGPQYVPQSGTTVGEPDSSIFQNNAFFSVGSGIYNGGTLTLMRRFDRGLQFRVNYTFSRAIDDTSDFSSLSTPFRPGLLSRDYSLSDFNITHNFVASAVYATQSSRSSSSLLPRLFSGVTVSPIVYVRSGAPFTSLVPGLSNGTIGHNANARPWLEGRNVGRGPGFFSSDLLVSKTVLRRDERQSLQLTAQAQNLFNRTNFAAVNNNFPVDPSYPLPGGGTLENGPFNVKGFAPTSVSKVSQPLAFTSSYPARQVSMALKFYF